MITARRAAEALEDQEHIDRLADPLAHLASRALRGPAKDALSGAWLGHTAHPLLTDLPIGAFTGATFLDVVGGRRARPAADDLVAAGIITALPTALTGLSDSAGLGRREQRVGLAHAAANNLGLAFYFASLVARWRGWRASGTLLGLLGATAMTAGGYLGGHLVYRLGTGVKRNDR